MKHNKQETHRKVHSTKIKLLNIVGITTDNQQLIAETFNSITVYIFQNNFCCYKKETVSIKLTGSQYTHQI